MIGPVVSVVSALQRGGCVEEVHILIVEDEFLLQELLREALTQASFVVIVANNGEEAIQRLDLEGDKIRAVVTDVNLGGKVNGWHVAHHARTIDSQMPVVYTTAYATEEWAAHGVPNSVHISKPFVPVQVVTAISQLLNSGSTTGSPP